MNTKTKLIIIFLSLFFAPLLVYFSIPSHQPLHLLPTPTHSQSSQHHYFILGFLPYWNLSKLTQPALHTIDNLAYFSLELKANGSLKKLDQPTQEAPSWHGFKQFQQLNLNQPLTLTFTTTNSKALFSLLNNATSRRQAINNILHLVTSTPHLTGVNIDFEPNSQVNLKTKANFTLFIQELDRQLNQLHPRPQLSIDIYPTATSPFRLWDLSQLEPLTDFFIVMAYDYHHRSNPAGPNAPLTGSGSNYSEDILKNLAELTKFIPNSKLLLGIPFYGWEWTTTNTTKYSSAHNKALASLSRINTLINQRQLEKHWDRNSLTPFIIYQDHHQTKQIYFDDLHSIQLKLQLVKDAQLKGIAIWALGYEGFNPQLWQTIDHQLHP